MLPYEHGLLRCHPSWTQLRDKKIRANIRTSSSIKAKWECCVCEATFEKTINNITISTGRCRPCSMMLIGDHSRYIGNIPIKQRTIIRCGVLQKLSDEEIVNILKQQESETENKEKTYREWLAFIQGQEYQNLLNNRYWNRNEIPWMNKRKRSASDDSFTTIYKDSAQNPVEQPLFIQGLSMVLFVLLYYVFRVQNWKQTNALTKTSSMNKNTITNNH